MFSLPTYERAIWHYQRTNVDIIQQGIKQFSYKKSFRNLNINEMVFLFNKTILIKLIKLDLIKQKYSNFIPHKTVTCDDIDPL